MNAIDPDGLCAWRMLGGIADIGTGLLLTAETRGIGLVVAWGLIINGADNLVAGAYSMIAGEEIPSLIQSGFRRAIPNRTAADLAYMGFEIGLNVAGLAVERAAIRAAQLDDIPSFEQLKDLTENTLDFSTKQNGTVFWSGSNMKRAQFFGKLTGKTTLEQTIGGQYLNSLKLFERWKNKALAAEIWDIASRRFAAQARGNCYVFRFFAKPIGRYGLRTWWRVEQPILLGRQAEGIVNKIRRFRIPFIDKLHF